MNKKFPCMSFGTTMQQKLYLTLYKLSKLQCSQLFLHPVDTNIYQDYLTTIQHPMDLTSIIKKLKEGEYQYLNQVHDDLRLICRNCFVYNKDKLNWKHMEGILGKFVKSMDLAWMSLKKQLSDAGVEENTGFLSGKQIEEKIIEIEQRIKISIIKKVERLSCNVLDTSVVLLGTQRQIASKKLDIVPEKNCQKKSICSEKNSVRSSRSKKSKSSIKDKNEVSERSLPKQPSQRENSKVQEKEDSIISKDKNSEKVSQVQQIRSQAQNISENMSSSYEDDRKNEKQSSQCTISMTMPIRIEIKSYTESVPIQKSHSEIQVDDSERNKQSLIEIDRTNRQSSVEQKQVVEIEDKQEENQITGQIEIRRDQVEQQLKNTTNRKLHKYQKLIQNYLIWILNNIINVKGNTICSQHSIEQDENSDQEDQNVKNCEDCIQRRKEERLYRELKSLLSYQYLSGFLNYQLNSLKKGDLDMKKLLKLLEEFNYWLKLQAEPYISWRIKEDYIEIQKCILICLEKIIQYKKLGPEFIKALQKPKQEINKTLNGRRITRSRAHIKKSQTEKVKKNNFSILSRLSQKQRNKFNLSEEKINEHEQFFNLLQKDQVKCDLKVVVYRDRKTVNRLKFLDKREYLIRKKNLLKKKHEQTASDEADSEEAEIEQGEYNPEVVQIKQIDRIFKKPKLNQVQLQAEQQRQEKIRVQSELQKDEQFLYQYGLRSNVLVIGKYKDRLQLDWDKKWEKVFGQVPSRLVFDEENTNFTNYTQVNRVSFCV